MARPFTLSVSFLSLALAAGAQNSTATGTVNVFEDAKVGWENGPTQRGTTTLVWGSIATVITCTWTILCLNLPALGDSPWEYRKRKAKWMGINILFPEFVFALSIEHLRLALDDLSRLQVKLSRTKADTTRHQSGLWKVHVGKLERTLGRVFGIEMDLAVTGKSEVVEQEEKKEMSQTETKIINAEEECLSNVCFPEYKGSEEQYVWTLTHSHFANMGGFIRNNEDETLIYVDGKLTTGTDGISVPLTATLLANCCVGSDHDPLKDLRISEEDIKDKSKADILLKLLTIWQVVSTLASIIVRWAENLPVTQLEVAVASFCIFAFATSLATLWKVKDVETPIQFPAPKSRDAFNNCQMSKNYRLGDSAKRQLPDSFSTTLNSFGAVYQKKDFRRAYNDTVPGWNSAAAPRVGINVAVSTLIFGGLYCVAWNFEFPTYTEKLLWRIASVFTAFLPGVSLILGFLLGSNEARGQRRTIEKLFTKPLLKDFAWLSQTAKWSKFEAFAKLPALEEKFEYHHQSEVVERGRKVKEIYQAEGCSAEQHCDDCYRGIWASASNISSLQTYLADLAIEGYKPEFFEFYRTRSSYWAGTCRPMKELWKSYEEYLISKDLSSKHEISSGILDKLFSHGQETMQLNDDWQKSKNIRLDSPRWDAFVGWIPGISTIIGSVLYGIARLIIIIIMFTSLRSVPAGVYTSTWTRFLPSYS